MDNRVFNVNGRGEQMLLATLRLVFEQSGHTTCEAWMFRDTHGLILLWTTSADKDAMRFPAKLTAEACLPFVLAWLQSDQAKTVKLCGWDKKIDHDGSDGDGWRVYCEDWGHVARSWAGICAITPAVMWYGK